MLKRSSSLLLAIIMLLGFSAQEVFADQTASVLVNFLLKKGIIQPEDAVEVLAEMEALETETKAGESSGTEDARLKKIPEKGILVSAKQGKKVEISGYVQGDAHFGDSLLRTPDNTAEIRRARLAVSGQIVDDVKYKLMVDATGDDILRDAEISYVKFPAASVTVGQFKAPFGQEELTSSSRIHTIERSVVSNAITPTRQIGAMLHGELFNGFLEYSGGAFNGNGLNTKNDDNDFMYVGRLAVNPYKGELAGKPAHLQLAGDIGTSEDTSATLSGLGFSKFKGDRDFYGLDGMFSWGALTLRGEYLLAELEFEGLPATETTKAVPAKDSDVDGYYVLGSYFLHPRWELVTKWEEFSGDSVKEFEAITGGLNYYFHDWTDRKLSPTRLMVNYVHGEREDSEEEHQVLVRMQVGY